MLVSEMEDESFAFDLAKLLESGGYRNGYKSSLDKRIAYRFECPVDENYPEIIEFFVREGVKLPSLDKRFAKLNVIVNEDKISAMILNGDVYDFANRHVGEIHGLSFSDKVSLIALKSFAYFENFKLYKTKAVDSEDYLKHERDILRILASMTPAEAQPIRDLPRILKESLENILPHLIQSNQRLKRYGLDKGIVKEMMERLLG